MPGPAGPARRPGVLDVKVWQARGPQAGLTAAITGELRAPTGKAVLATLAAAGGVQTGQTATVTFTFSKAGLRWLATHTRTMKLRAVISTQFPRELANTRSELVQLDRSRSFERQLAKLVRPSRARHRRR
ncbi:MAG: hypothetical protein PGN13_01580 [Patulibacter minatonensis]